MALRASVVIAFHKPKMQNVENYSSGLIAHIFGNFTAAAMPMLAALISIPMLISALGMEQYGLYVLLNIFLAYTSNFDFGIPKAIVRYYASQNDGDERRKLITVGFMLVLAIGLLGSFAFYFFATEVSQLVVGGSSNLANDFREAFTLIAYGYWLFLLSPLSNALLHAKLKIRLVNGLQGVASTCMQLIPAIYCYLYSADLMTAIALLLTIKTLQIILMLGHLSSDLSLSLTASEFRFYVKKVIDYTKWLGPSNIIGVILLSVDKLVISATLGPAKLALYSIPADLVGRLLVIQRSFNQALFPRLAGLTFDEATDTSKHSESLIRTLMSLITIIAIFLIDEFVEIWIGVGVANEAAFLAKVLLVGIWWNALVTPYHAQFLATKNPRPILFLFVTELTLFYVALLLIVPIYGLLGAATLWSIRVVLDSLVILKLNHMVGEVFQRSISHLIIVTSGYFISTLRLGFFIDCVVMIILVILCVLVLIKSPRS